jgi:hypothetical protein
MESTNSKEAEGTPYYYEVLAQRGNLSEDLGGKALLGKRAVFVAGDGSCALNAVLKGVGITISPSKVTAADQRNYEVVRDSIRSTLAAAAVDHYPQVAARLQDGDKWLHFHGQGTG